MCLAKTGANNNIVSGDDYLKVPSFIPLYCYYSDLVAAISRRDSFTTDSVVFWNVEGGKLYTIPS